MDQEPDEVEIAAGDKKIKVRGYDILTIFIVVAASIGLYVVYQHTHDTKDSNEQIAKSIAALASSQREMACIISLPQDQRLIEFTSQNGLCRRLATQ